jgi:hypothetical protein
VSRVALLRVATLPFETLAGLAGGDAAAAAAKVVALEAAGEREGAAIAEELFSVAGPPSDDPGRTKRRFALLRVRRDLHNGKPPRAADLTDAAPLVPAPLADRLSRQIAAEGELSAARSAFAASFGASLARARGELLRIAEGPLVYHGIGLASRSLLPKIRRLARAGVDAWSHDDRHAASKLAAYVARFAAKTSPNGVFCAVAPVRIGGDRASVAGRAEIDRVDVLLSLAEVRKIAAVLAIDPAVAPAVRPRPNPTLLRTEGGWTFWKPASPRNPTDAETMARVKDQPVLAAFLDAARGGDLDPERLVAAVAARIGHPPAELAPFYALLVERGILIGEVEVPYSSRRRLRDLASIVRSAGCEPTWAAALAQIEDAVDAIPALPLGDRSAAMDLIVDEVAKLPRRREYKPDELFRVDAASALDVTLPQPVLDDLARSVGVLVRLLAGMYPEEVQHRRLVARFLERHPPDVDVDFLELYRTPTDRAAPAGAPPHEFPKPAAEPPADTRERSAWEYARRVHAWLVARAREAAPGEPIVFDDAVVRSLVGEGPAPRWAAGALFQVAAASPADVDAGRYTLIVSALFNGIGLALSRFAHLLDRGADGSLTAELRRAWSAIARPGAILAELTFNHEARTANAGLRPALFGHEIELPGDLASPGVARIALSDLSIRFDSASDRLVLRSVSRGAEVIPVLSSGVSPSGIVSELIHIGRQGWQTVGYLPGFRDPEVTHWPRVVCGRVVLFRERWTFGPDRLPATSRGGATLSDADFFLSVARWRQEHALPRHVFVHTSAEPKPFCVDLDSPVLADLLRRAIASLSGREDGALGVTEMAPAPGALWIRDGGGSYASEFLVQLGSDAPPSSS